MRLADSEKWARARPYGTIAAPAHPATIGERGRSPEVRIYESVQGIGINGGWEPREAPFRPLPRAVT